MTSQPIGRTLTGQGTARGRRAVGRQRWIPPCADSPGLAASACGSPLASIAVAGLGEALVYVGCGTTGRRRAAAQSVH